MRLRVTEQGSAPNAALFFATPDVPAQSTGLFVVTASPGSVWTSTQNVVTVLDQYPDGVMTQLYFPTMPRNFSRRITGVTSQHLLPDEITATVSEQGFLSSEFDDSELSPEEGGEVFFSGSVTGIMPRIGQAVAISQNDQRDELSMRIVSNFRYISEEDEEDVLLDE